MLFRLQFIAMSLNSYDTTTDATLMVDFCLLNNYSYADCIKNAITIHGGSPDCNRISIPAENSLGLQAHTDYVYLS